MIGYDTNLIGNFYGYTQFQKQFGSYHKGSGYQVSGPWQIALSCGPTAGALVGALANGHLIGRFGYKKTFLVTLMLMNAFIFVSFFGNTVQLQMVGQVLCGIPWGVFATIGSAYASELCPLQFRGYLTAYTNMCFATGQFISGGVLQALLNVPNQWSYRIAYAVQWAWPTPLFIIALFMPESPWWLVRRGRYQDAEHSVRRLVSKRTKIDPKQTVAMMIHTNNIEQEIESGSSYLDCFRGHDLRRTEIACVTFAGQVLSGSSFAYSATYFFEQAGMSANDAYKLSLGGTAIAFVGTILSWVLMSRIGRRTIYLWGMGLMALYCCIIGILTCAAPHNNAATWAQSALCIVWLFTFSLSAGPIGWAIPAEVSSTRLRSKTVVLARNTYYLANIFGSVVEPYMMNPTEWNWKGKTGFWWAATGFLVFIWAFFRLTETRNRTFEELDLMFAGKVPTRKFKRYQVDAYAEDVALEHRAKEL